MTRRVRTTTSGTPWGFRGQLLKPHDGDSFWMTLDLGFHVHQEAELRLDGVHAPEIHPLQPGGQETLDFVNGWMAGVMGRNQQRDWPFWISVTPTKSYEPAMDMSFTRYVATVWDATQAFNTYIDPDLSLNAAVNTFLSGHPEWPSGD